MMKPSRLVASTVRFCLLSALVLWEGFVPGASATTAAQQPPPIGGGTGTIAVEATQKKVYSALNVVIVQTIDGVEHAIHYTKDLLVHGGKGTGGDALQGLEEGSTVAVHYTRTGTDETAREIDCVGGDQGLKKAEGVLTRVDRGRQQITIKFADGTTETLQLTERAAAEAGSDLGGESMDGTKVVVYYSDEAGHKVAHFFKFKKIS